MEKLFTLAVRRPLWVLGVIFVITLGLGVQATHVRLDSSVGTLLPSDDPEMAYYEEVRSRSGSEEIGVIGVLADDVYSPAALQKVQKLTDELAALEGIESVQSLTNALDPASDVFDPPPLIGALPTNAAESDALRAKIADRPIYLKNLVSADGRAATINLFFAPVSDREFLESGLDAKITAIVAAAQGPEEVLYTGLPHLKVYTVERMRGDLRRLVPATFLVVLVLLWVSFRSYRGVMLPALTVVVSLVWTLGLMGATGVHLSLGTIALPPLLLVLGTAYSLHLLADYFDESSAEVEHEEAILTALRRTAIPVAIAAFTTALGFLSLTVSAIPGIRDMGIYAAFGIAVSSLLAMILVPALLALGGRAPVSSRAEFSPRLRDGLRRLAAIDTQHRRPILVVGATVAALCSVALFSIQIDSNFQSFFPKNDPVRRATDIINERVVGTMAFYVVVDGGRPGAIQSLDSIERLRRFQQRIDAIPGVEKTLSFVDYLEVIDQGSQVAGTGDLMIDEDGNLVESPAEAVSFWDESQRLEDVLALVTASPKSFARVVNADFSRTNLLVRTSLSRSSDLAAAADRILAEGRQVFPAEIGVHPTGTVILHARTTEHIVKGQIQSLGLAAAVIFLVMSAMFLSLRVGLIAMVPNLFPILFFFGLMGATGAVLSPSTSIIASIVLGIAVDDTVHLMTRISGEVRATGDQQEAVARALVAVGKPVIFTTMLLVAGFSTLAFSTFVPIREFGWLAAATFVAALGADLVLLPAMLATTRFVTLWDVLYLRLGRDPHKTIPMFADLRPSQAKLVALMGELRRFSTGQAIVRQGEVGDEMFVIIRGRANVVVHKGEGSVVVRELGRGDVLGEMGLIRNHERTADVIAAADVEVMAMDRNFLATVQRRYPRIATRIFFNLARILGDRLDEVTQRAVG